MDIYFPMPKNTQQLSLAKSAEL